MSRKPPDNPPPESQQSGSEGPAEDVSLDRLAEHLRELGAETETERRVKRIVPWVTSAAFHAALIFLGFVIVFAVQLTKEEEPVVVSADFDSLSYQPVAMLNPNQSPQNRERTQDRLRTESLAETIEERLRDIEVDPALFSDAAGSADLARFAPDPAPATAKFAGLTGTNARRIAFVVDASGSMITTFRVVIEELARSIDQLSPQQSFTVVFFQADEAVVVPPLDRMIEATREQKIRVLKWIDENVVPRSRSNPVEAIRHALKLDPDVVFVLSERFTGSGQFEIDQDDLLAILDELNPVDSNTGRRNTQIKCVQFLYPDPLETLKRIGEIHGGENGYRFYSAEELGLAPN